jgi:hypothetical protein
MQNMRLDHLAARRHRPAVRLTLRVCLVQAYPDMLEVGNMASFAEDQSHFGAWCVVSSPLILGYDVAQSEITTRVWPIISNREAIRVNQQWAGHPGRLIKAWNHSPPPPPLQPGQVGSYPVAVTCNASAAAQSRFTYDIPTMTVRQTTSTGAYCLAHDPTGGHSDLRLLPCTPPGPKNASLQFDRTPTGELQLASYKVLCLDIFCGPCHEGAPLQLSSCNNGSNQEFGFAGGAMKSKGSQCIVGLQEPPAGDAADEVKGKELSLWAKAQPGGAQAVFLLSNQPNTSSPTTVDITFAELGLSSPAATVRDIWSQQPVGKFNGKFTTPPISGHESHFFLFTPAP